MRFRNLINISKIYFLLIIYFFVFCAGIKCPVCAKFVLPDDVECHLVMCLTKPRLTYNGELKIVFTQVLIIIISWHLNCILYAVW